MRERAMTVGLGIFLMALAPVGCSRTLTAPTDDDDGSGDGACDGETSGEIGCACTQVSECDRGLVCRSGRCTRRPQTPSNNVSVPPPSPDTMGPAIVSPTPFCGNGIRELNEACDGRDFDGLSCESGIFTSGVLTCTSDCQIDYSACAIGTPVTSTDNAAHSLCQNLAFCGSFGVDDEDACALSFSDTCFQCIRTWAQNVRPLDDDDAGTLTLCDVNPDPTCLDACAALIPPPDSPAHCASVGERAGFDGQCACNACQLPLQACYAGELCSQLLPCFTRTGCVAAGNCGDQNTCGPLLARASDVQALNRTYAAASCIQSAGCQ